MDIGSKISRLRGDHSPEWLAKQIGCHGLTIRRCESGEQRPGDLRAMAIADLFAVDLRWLVDDSFDWPPPETDAQAATRLVEQALAGAGLIGELSDLEREIVAIIRSLPTPAMREILAYSRGVRDGAAAGGGTAAAEPAESPEAAALRAELNRRLDAIDRKTKRTSSAKGA